MSKITGKAFDLDILGRVLKYVKPYRTRFVFTFLLTVCLAAISPLRPMLIQHTFDNYIVTPDADGLLMMTLVIVAVLLLEALLYYFYTFSANWLGQTVIKDLRMEIYNHINSLKLQYFDKTAIGTLVTRVVSDIETIADIFSNGILVIFGDILKLVTVVAVMFYVDWQLTLISLSTIPILLVATYIFKNGIRSSFQDVRTQVSRLNAFLQEHITGMHIVQVFNREKKEMERFQEINAQHRDAHIRSIWYYAVFMPVVEILSATSLGLIVWWGAGQVMRGEVSLGDLVMFILFIHMLFRPIRELADKFNTLQMGMVAADRVFKVLDTTSNIQDHGQDTIENIKGDLEFADVKFSYVENEVVLKGVSFKVTAGDTIAIVGSTGAGKSTIVNLLNRLYDIDSGNITIDYKDLRTISIKSLRKNIAVVHQDVFLFADTILNNITLSNPAISELEVQSAAKEIGVHDFIMSLPNGYHYNVKERGVMLSSGQRQLISFLRAYVTNPKILILDEATASIDSYSEQLIQKATQKITHGRTSIVIAHRLATIQKSDMIIVLDAGQIVEKGTHEELLATKNGHYRNLYDAQFLTKNTVV